MTVSQFPRRPSDATPPSDFDYWAQISTRPAPGTSIGMTRISPAFREQHELAQWLRAHVIPERGDIVYVFERNRRTGKDRLLRALGEDQPGTDHALHARVLALRDAPRGQVKAAFAHYPEHCPVCDGPCREPQASAQWKQTVAKYGLTVENVETPEEPF
jgi:hypothetical protein